MQTGAVAVEAHLLKPEGCSRKKSPAPAPAPRAETERRARFSYDDLLGLFTCWTCYLILLAKLTLPAKELSRLPVICYGSIATPGSRPELSRLEPGSCCRKNPSSYPDFSTRPFCKTTLTRPLNRNDFNRCSMEPESTSPPRTFRRNSTKFFASLQLSAPVMTAGP